MELKLEFKGAAVTVEVGNVFGDPVDAVLESGSYDWPQVDLTDAELDEVQRLYEDVIQQAVLQEQAETAHDRFEMMQGDR